MSQTTKRESSGEKELAYEGVVHAPAVVEMRATVDAEEKVVVRTSIVDRGEVQEAASEEPTKAERTTPKIKHLALEPALVAPEPASASETSSALDEQVAAPVVVVPAAASLPRALPVPDETARFRTLKRPPLPWHKRHPMLMLLLVAMLILGALGIARALIGA
jgi:hypothetical protein